MNHHASAASSRIADFSPLELAKLIPVRDAAQLNGVHEDTFKKNYPHLIRKVGPRKAAVTLRDALTLPPAPEGPDPGEKPAPNVHHRAARAEKVATGIT
jgi:hypothetical protein